MEAVDVFSAYGLEGLAVAGIAWLATDWLRRYRRMQRLYDELKADVQTLQRDLAECQRSHAVLEERLSRHEQACQS